MSEYPLISVIVPIYKVEKYLHKCVDSILAQTYTNLEIILVDDGSPDNCPVICDEYEKKFLHIRTVHRENGGQSCARNTGLSVANGDYIGFVDSDDYIAPNMYEKLYAELIKASTKIAVCGFTQVDESGKLIETNNIGKNPLTDEVLSAAEIMPRLWGRSGTYYTVAWNRLYDRKLFENIAFPEGVICEDEFTAHRFYHYASNATFIKESLYYYVLRNNSTMTNAFSVKRLSGIYAGFDRYEFVKAQGYGIAAEKISMRISYGTLIQAYLKGDKCVRAECKPLYGKTIKLLIRLGEYTRAVNLFIVSHGLFRRIYILLGLAKRYGND